MAQVRNIDAGPVEVPALGLHFAAGETVDVDDATAALFPAGGLIERVDTPTATPAAAAPEQIAPAAEAAATTGDDH